MGVEALQNYLESDSVPGACVPVDLLRLVRNTRNKQRGGKNATQQQQQALSLVVDAECCLDRLYGGFFSDWACGGQWNRMVQFLATLITTVQNSNVQLTFFFNGAVENQRMDEWVRDQVAMRQKINAVLRHVSIKGTPPPKIWWTPPVCLRTCLRMALRRLNVGLACSMDDHHQEVIAYCRENNCSGIMADDGEYAAFDPPRYFSSEQIKLTYKGSLETKEFVLGELTKVLGVSGDRLCVLAALLGNYLLGQHELADLYSRLGLKEQPAKIPPEQLVKALSSYVKTLPAPDQLDALTEQVFGALTDKRAARFRQSVKYYMNGTKDGFLSYKPQHSARRPEKGGKSSAHHAKVSAATSAASSAKKDSNEEQLDYSRLASETTESQEASLAAYCEAAAQLPPAAPQIVIDPPATAAPVPATPPNKVVNGSGLLLSSSSSSSSSGAASPSHLGPSVGTSDKPAWLKHIPHEVMRTVCERHEKGLMSPLIYQIFTQGELKLPVVMEEETQREVPAVQQFYRPIRQLVYAILFNVHHHKYMASKNHAAKTSGSEAVPDVPGAGDALRDVCALHVKEWTWSRDNPYRVAELVAPEQLCWGVPTIQRLWFGASMDDKRRRMRAYLTCMRSDSALLMNPAYVPQHLLVMATVLRYIMSHTDKLILRKPELDAFIAQAFSPDLMDAQELQELQLPSMSARGIQLAALFMAGADAALLANDACGAPIPWLMCCPWLYFDGKLFHYKLARTDHVKNLLELCDHRIDVVVKVERMRKAILEGLDYQFLQLQVTHAPMRHNLLPAPPGALLSSSLGPRMKPGGMALPSGGYPMGRAALMRRSVPARGGQLEIAGVVVGQWGANYGTRPGQGAQQRMPARHHTAQPPQVTSVGGVKNYRGSYNGYGRPSFTVARGRAGSAQQQQQHQPPRRSHQGLMLCPSNNNKKKKASKGRGVTIETANGTCIPIAQLAMIPTPLKSGDITSLAGQFDDAVSLKVNGTSEEHGQGDGTANVAVPAAAVQ